MSKQEDVPIGKKARKLERQSNKKKEKRIRTDTFWCKSSEEITELFEEIFNDKHKVYILNKRAKTKIDYLGVERDCWCLLSRTNNNPAQLLSTKAYRCSVVWSVYSSSFEWASEGERQSVKDKLKTVLTKHGDHCRHLCGIDWCCNPSHIMIGTRTTNEEDKHFHYFLNNESEDVSKRFRETFSDLMREKGLW